MLNIYNKNVQGYEICGTTAMTFLFFFPKKLCPKYHIIQSQDLISIQASLMDFHALPSSAKKLIFNMGSTLLLRMEQPWSIPSVQALVQLLSKLEVFHRHVITRR